MFNADLRLARGTVCIRLLSSAKVTAKARPGPLRLRHNRWQADNQEKSLSGILKSPVNQSASFSTWLSCLLTDGTVNAEYRKTQGRHKKDS